jgi:cytochrome c-type biogenesis protein CcmH
MDARARRAALEAGVRRLLAALALAALLAMGGGAALAIAATCPKTSLADVEDEVMCPVCGVPLGLATEAPQAQRERAFIQREVESCKSKQEIKDALVAQFGDRVLALPPDKGFNLVAYLVPAAVVLGGIAAVTTIALHRRRRGTEAAGGNGAAAAADPEIRGEDAARLEADLERYDL